MGTQRTASKSMIGERDRDPVDELRQPLHDDRRGEDAGRRAGPADDHDGDQLQRLEQYEGVLGADRSFLDREQAAGQADDRAGQRVREQLGRTRLDAEALRPGLDVAHGEERAPGLRHREALAHDEHDCDARQREEIEAKVAHEERRAFERLIRRGEVLPGEQEVLGRRSGTRGS